MDRKTISPVLLLALAGGLAGLVSCRNSPNIEPPPQPPPARLNPTVIDYVDSAAFDALFESALVNEVPVLVVRTGHQKPDWDGRLNAWIAAWNVSGKVNGRTVRGQGPLPKVVVDGDSIREFRLLIRGLMDRVECLAAAASTWWAEDRIRSHRIALLRPYNLRFHMTPDKMIVLIFFHGKYARHYGEVMQWLTDCDTNEVEPWTRTFACSECKALRQADGVTRLTGRVEKR